MISRAALFDELVKIGADAARKDQEPKKGIGTALRAMAVGAAGGALGYGAAALAGKHFRFFHSPNEQRLARAKIIIPILGGTVAMLADRYRHHMNKQYSRVRGFGDRDKK